MPFQLDLTNSIFLFCLLVGGALLLVTILVDDVLGGLLDLVGLGPDIGGVSLMPPLLGFVSMFGVGGLVGTQLLGLANGPASLLGAVTGAAGAALVLVMFSVLKRSEGAQAFSIQDLIGHAARVSVAIPARRHGSVFVSYAGTSHQYSATSDVDIDSGSAVRITAVAGSDLVVEPAAGGGK